MKKINHSAFSLIEILVSLIIISLLVGAFTPVVTKKLKSSDITVGSFGAISSECDEYSTGDYKCLMCASGHCSLCSSQINTPTGYYVDPSETCEPKKCSDKFGSSCTACTKDECTSCNTTIGAGQYVDPSQGCGALQCSEKFGSTCSACTKDSCVTYSCPAGYGYNSVTHACTKCDAGYASPGGASGCTKCSSGWVSSAGASVCTECKASEHKVANAAQTACENKYCGAGKYIDGITCKDCTAGTYQNKTTHQDAPCPGTCSASDHKVVNANKTGCESVYCKIANQYIDGVTCKSCPVGTYHALVSSTGDQNTSCTSCPTGCSACTSATKCTGCTGIYTLNSSGQCTLGCNPQTVTLSGATTQVTRFNMGDDPQCPRSVLEAMTGVKFVPVGTNCSDNYCCWYGATATTNCTDQSGGIYSGCNRTVCTWYAADKICQSIGTGWALPATNASMSKWYANSTASTGLMLCDNSVSSAKSSKCPRTTDNSCLGSAVGNCGTFCIWAYSNSGDTAQNRRLEGGSWADNGSYKKLRAFGVRCVKE